MKQIKRPGDHPFKTAVVSLMNKLFCKNFQPLNDFWTEELMPELLSKFKTLTLTVGASKEERASRVIKRDPTELKLEREEVLGRLKEGINMQEIFYRVNKMLGLQWENHLLQELKVNFNPNLFPDH